MRQDLQVTYRQPYMMDNYDCFELRRLSDDLVYTFDRMTRADGTTGYKRRDGDYWIVFSSGFGWIAVGDEPGGIAGRSWTVLPKDQADHPPEGEWVSKKGVKSYVYRLVYTQPRGDDHIAG